MDEDWSAIFAFPAHAGMNRPQSWGQAAAMGVPRTRGDEPVAIFVKFDGP